MVSREDFSNQVAVVSGAGEGIGYEIARQLALNGAEVLLNDLDEAKARRAATTIAGEGGRCVGVGGDVGDVATVRDLVDQAVETFGHVDIAVANAGITLWTSFLDFEPENFFRILSVNLGGSFFLAQAAARQMRVQGSGGRILFISSVSAHQAIEYLSAYGMTKAALEMLARQLVVELSPFNITVNAIAPGATVTPRNIADEPNFEAVWERVTPTGRPAFTGDAAHAALFFLSPASSPVPSLDFVEDSSKDHE